jgi:hypothetical protein
MEWEMATTLMVIVIIIPIGAIGINIIALTIITIGETIALGVILAPALLGVAVKMHPLDFQVHRKEEVLTTLRCLLAVRAAEQALAVRVLLGLGPLLLRTIPITAHLQTVILGVLEVVIPAQVLQAHLNLLEVDSQVQAVIDVNFVH